VSRRIVLLVAAVMVAALGTTLVFLYANSANDRALAGQRPATVLVATDTIGAGTPAGDLQTGNLVKHKKVPQSALAPGALNDLRSVAKKTTSVRIYPGQQLLAAMFNAAGSQPAVAIPPGHLAMTVSLGDPQRVAGYVNPGSKVAVFLTTDGDKDSKDSRTRLLLPNMEVLAVGATTTKPQHKSTDNRRTPASDSLALLTLAVTQHQAEQIIFAQTKGALYFGLLSGKSSVTPADKGVGSDNLFARQ
jgi:pilus assembly protein CpaB